MNTEMQLRKSLISGYVDSREVSQEILRPKLLINNHRQGQKVLTSIINELNNCDEFFFSVAFITYSGLITLLNTLEELEKKGIKGKIVASKYLNFTEPKALEKLLSYKNIELRIVVEDNLHSKGYIFKKNDHYNLIVGSSNMTQNALSFNKEWNLKVSSMENGSIVLDTLNEFEKVFSSGININSDWISEYTKIYRKHNVKKILDDTNEAENVADSIGAYNTTLLTQVSPNKMQVDALAGIENIRNKGAKKALLISATGTGKTYLSCFDIAKFEPKKVLFLAHREQILNQAIHSFHKVLGQNIDIGKVAAGMKQFERRFVFSTIQTMSKQENLDMIAPDNFDYIVVDESHRAGALSYKRILEHFSPKFLLGMTATPERSDGYNICEDFDYNIAYEIRLEQAMAENMLCPFHYFGISELEIDGRTIDENSDFRYLTSSTRVDHIIDKIKHYGHGGDSVNGLVFCSRNDEAKALSDDFNRRGYKTVALSGKDTQEERERTIKKLEGQNAKEKLDYIFTVDIFNEGVDIPNINQVIMLRPTKSAIIFVQQLGRGLRKHLSKEFVVVLDFIGNYQNNFMIPIALSDDRSFNKDTIRRFVAEGNRVIPGCSTINFDAISKKKIYKSIDNTDFSKVKHLKESYQNLKFRLGKIPKLMDFENHDSMDIARVFESKSIKSYHNFLVKYEEDYNSKLNDLETKFIECISVKFASGKRPHELLVLKNIIDGISDIIEEMKRTLEEDYQIEVQDKTIINIYNVLTNEFASGSSKKTYEDCPFLKKDKDKILASDIFLKALENKDFKDMVKELIALGLYRNKKYYGKTYKNTSLQLYQKYTYEDVCRLLEWEKNIVSLNIGGYKYDEKTKTYPVFINYHKPEDISETTKYEDRFLSNQRLIAISKSKRTPESKDVKTAYQAKEKDIHMELFVRKNKDDKVSKEFYYLGRMNTTGTPKQFQMNGNGPSAVELEYLLDIPVREDIYDYIIEV